MATQFRFGASSAIDVSRGCALPGQGVSQPLRTIWWSTLSVALRRWSIQRSLATGPKYRATDVRNFAPKWTLGVGRRPVQPMPLFVRQSTFEGPEPSYGTNFRHNPERRHFRTTLALGFGGAFGPLPDQQPTETSAEADSLEAPTPNPDLPNQWDDVSAKVKRRKTINKFRRRVTSDFITYEGTSRCLPSMGRLRKPRNELAACRRAHCGPLDHYSCLASREGGGMQVRISQRPRLEDPPKRCNEPSTCVCCKKLCG